jgi:hypothetical protein
MTDDYADLTEQTEFDRLTKAMTRSNRELYLYAQVLPLYFRCSRT